MTWGSRKCDSTGQGKKADSQPVPGTKAGDQSRPEEAGREWSPVLSMSRKALDICGTGNPRGQVGAQWMVRPVCGVADKRQVQLLAPDGQLIVSGC